MILKKGVSVKQLSPQIVVAIVVADSVYKEFGKELVITSVCDGRHRKASLHYSGNAIDLRTRYFGRATAIKVAQALVDKLTIDYDVVLEDDHIHIEYDPKS